jgi:hypothetical protein
LHLWKKTTPDRFREPGAHLVSCNQRLDIGLLVE